MNGHTKALQWIQTVLAPHQLTQLEKVVLRMTLAGKSYRQMSEETGYHPGYLKDIGSQLWLPLSQRLGCEVNKRNLSFILHQFSQSNNETSNTIITPPNPGWETLNFPGCPLAFHSPLYIERPPIETFAVTTLQKPGSLLRIKAPHQMGKTSLIHRLLGIAERKGMRTVVVNVQQADPNNVKDLEQFLLWICVRLSQQLNLAPKFDDYWIEEAGSKTNFTIYLQEYILTELQAPLVIAFDKVHSLFENPNLGDHFLSMVRCWSEQARSQDGWDNLRLVLAYSRELTLSIQTNQSPFNVGISLHLPPFTTSQICELAGRHDLDPGEMEMLDYLRPLLDLVGGHPYLLQLAFYWLRSGYWSLTQLVAEAPTDRGIYGEYLGQLRLALERDRRLHQEFYQVLSSSEPVLLDSEVAYALEGLGLVKLKELMASPACELYRQYFGSYSAVRPV